MKARFLKYICVPCLLCVWSIHVHAQSLPSPKDFFGFQIGDDYKLVNYAQAAAYFEKLASLSNRIKLIDIGKTEEGRTQYMLILSSPANLANLATYKTISQKLARAESLTDAEAQQMSKNGKAVVWIDGGLHATEVVGAHQLIETIWQLASRNDEETQRILENDIVLLTHANPDGQDLVSNWYMSEKDTLKRNLNIPILYEKYIGHDNNRDFYIMNMKESQNMAKQLFVEWIPQIMYNHHQRGPAGSVIAGPPYRDPFNYVFDPLMITGIDALGAAMYNRLNVEDKPGLTRLTGSTFSTWYNGGLRTTTQYHNTIGLLTEIIGGPTPETIQLVPQRLVPNGATPNPVLPQTWHFRQSIDYSVSLNYAVLDYAARQKDEVLYNMYKMGKNAIDKGNRDNWTLYPSRADSIVSKFNQDQAKEGKRTNSDEDPMMAMFRPKQIPMKYYDAIYKNPETRDPRAYVIPADQADFPTAVAFINALLKAGIDIYKANTAFSFQGHTYPVGSYVVKTDQSFRPHVLDMFEPQDYPNDFQYPGGPPIRPYDAAGWTLAYQMGVKFDRLLEGIEIGSNFTKLPYEELERPLAKGRYVPKKGAGYLVTPAENNAFIATNMLIAKQVAVFRITEGANLGKMFIPYSKEAEKWLVAYADSLGITVQSTATRPKTIHKIVPARIALWDKYGGSIQSGWTRWILEQYKFPYEIVYPGDIDKGGLKDKYDVIVFLNGAIPEVKEEGNSPESIFGREPDRKNIPADYQYMLGRITKEKSIPVLKEFLEQGGKIIAVGSSANLAYQLQLPVSNALVYKDKSGNEKPLPGTKFYIPGSLLDVAVDSTLSSAWGMGQSSVVNFAGSPVFKILDRTNIKPIAWYASEYPLKSGWAWGQRYLKDGIAAFEASVGKGKLFVYGPDITFRGQSHTTYKLLFNDLYKD